MFNRYQYQCSVCPDLGPNSLQRLSADDKNHSQQGNPCKVTSSKLNLYGIHTSNDSHFSKTHELTWGDPGFLERGFIYIKVWGFPLLILPPFSTYPMKMK